MLAHVRSPACSGKPEEAIDILRTGIARSSPSSSPSPSSSSSALDEAALLLAWSDAEASRCGRSAAAELAARAAGAAASAAQEDLPGLLLRLSADDACLRSSLTRGDGGDDDDKGISDAEAAAADAAEAASRTESSVASAAAAGMAAVLSHARGDAETARSAAEAVESALRRMNEEEEEEEGAVALASLAVSRAAAVRLASGEAASAIELYSEAVALADKAAAAAASSSNLTSPLAAADASVAALAGRAQARFAAALPRPPPAEAEEDATRALSSFDGERERFNITRPEAAAAPLLLVLGQAFATSGGRVMVAEGLFRRAAQRLKIDPSSFTAAASPPRLSGGCVHPSVASALAWRYAQLLAALPKRGTESEGWARAATSSSSASREQLEISLGSLDALTGKGDRGKGVVVDAASRRVLPWLKLM